MLVAPRNPLLTRLAAFGLTMYQAMPARCAPPSGLTAVSRDPQTLPLAYITCCMRVSFESGRETTSFDGAPTSSAKQPLIGTNSGVVVSLRHLPCGTVSPGAVPEPGCCCFGG